MFADSGCRAYAATEGCCLQVALQHGHLGRCHSRCLPCMVGCLILNTAGFVVVCWNPCWTPCCRQGLCWLFGHPVYRRCGCQQSTITAVHNCCRTQPSWEVLCCRLVVVVENRGAGGPLLLHLAIPSCTLLVRQPCGCPHASSLRSGKMCAWLGAGLTLMQWTCSVVCMGREQGLCCW